MPSPNFLRAVAALAPGRRVTVLTRGNAYELPLTPAPAEVAPPHPMEAASKQLLERDAETRASVASVAEAVARIGETAAAVQAAVAGMVSGQSEVAQSVAKLADVMAMDTVPLYNEKGKLVGTRRVDKRES